MPEELFFTSEEVTGSLDQGEWDILVIDARPCPVIGPEGQLILSASEWAIR